MPLPVPEDAPFYIKDYSEYYKGRCYHPRSLNSNDGWNSVGCQSFMNQPILKCSNEIRSAVLILHGDKAHSYYFGKDAYMDEMLLDLITETQIKLSGQKSLLLNMNKGEYKKQIKRRYDTQRKELVG